jgi:uncharacterized protein YegL
MDFSGSSAMEQVPFHDATFAENPEPRVPCVLLLDVSNSMSGEPMDELNAGLNVYKRALVGDSLAAKRVEVALVTFGDEVQTVREFTTAENFAPPQLTPRGDTPMGAAIHCGIDMVQTRKQIYRSNGIAFTARRPTNGVRPPIAFAKARPAGRFRSSRSG